MHKQLLNFRGEGLEIHSMSVPTAALPDPVSLPHFLRVVNVDIIGPGPVGNPR